jgi:hypothetical protein
MRVWSPYNTFIYSLIFHVLITSFLHCLYWRYMVSFGGQELGLVGWDSGILKAGYFLFMHRSSAFPLVVLYSMDVNDYFLLKV